MYAISRKCDIYTMQSLNSVSSDSVQAASISPASIPPVSIQPSAQSALGQTARSPGNPVRQPNRSYRCRPNSWLSRSDASLLLRSQARWQAQQKNYVAAVQAFDQLVIYEPDNADHYANRGLMHYQLQQWDRALADYSYAIELNGELDRAYSNRANLYASQQSWTAAIADYDQAIDLNPLNIRARLNQAITFRQMGDYAEALTCLDIALFFRPESATLRAERGRIYHLQGDWNCAITDYRAALALTADILAANSSDLSHFSTVNRQVLNWMSSLY